MIEFGCTTMDLCMVADGRIGAFGERAPDLYDGAVGALIAREVGVTAPSLIRKARALSKTRVGNKRETPRPDPPI